jgi:hypothetical protein
VVAEVDIFQDHLEVQMVDLEALAVELAVAVVEEDQVLVELVIHLQQVLLKDFQEEVLDHLKAVAVVEHHKLV